MNIFDIFPSEIWIIICEYIFLPEVCNHHDFASLLYVSPKLTYLIIKYIKHINTPYFIRKKNTWNKNDDFKIRQKLNLLFPEINKIVTNRKKPFYDTVCMGICKKGKYKDTMWYQKKIDIEGDYFINESNHYQYFRENFGICPICKINLPPLCFNCSEPVIFKNEKYRCYGKKCYLDRTQPIKFLNFECYDCEVSKYTGQKFTVSKEPYYPFIFTLFTLDQRINKVILVKTCQNYYENNNKAYNLYVYGYNGMKKLDKRSIPGLSVISLPEVLLDSMLRIQSYKIKTEIILLQ